MAIWVYEKVEDSGRFCGHAVMGKDLRIVDCGEQADYHIMTPTHYFKFYCKEHAYADTLIPAIEKGERIFDWYRLINRDDCDQCRTDILMGRFFSTCLKYEAVFEFAW
jgi:hypothetical protein